MNQHEETIVGMRGASAGVGRGRSQGSKRNQFKPGRSPNPGGKKKPEPLLSNESQPMLEAMRFVVSDTLDRTNQQRELRRWLNEDRKGFMSKLVGLEETEIGRGKKGETGGAGVDMEDEGTERCLELIDRLLKEFEDEKRGQ